MILPKGVKKKEAKQKIVYLPNITLSDVEIDTVIGSVSYTYDGKEVGHSDILYHPFVSKTLVTSSHVRAVVSLKEKLISNLVQKFMAHKYLFTAVLVGLVVLLVLFLLYLFFTRIRYSRTNRRRKQRYEYSFEQQHRKRRR